MDSSDATADPPPSAEPATGADPGPGGAGPDELDLDAVERDLHGIEVALERLDAGTYHTDEIDGRPIPDEVLERDPLARRAP